MRHGASTVVALVGEVRAGVPEAAARARNVALVAPEGEGFEAALRAMERAEGASAPYTLVAADPLEGVAQAWRRLWTGAETPGEEGFEHAVRELLTAESRILLPDYYIVLAARPPAGGRPEPHRDDFHLGVLSSARSARVVGITPGVAVTQDAARLLATLPRLRQGPWWPPLEHLVASARGFFPGSLAGASQA
jgi:hypothetical protein